MRPLNCTLILLMGLLTGCVVVPKKVTPSDSEHRPENDVLEFLYQPGLARPEVLAKLGHPLTRTNDDRVYLYLYYWRISSMETHLINPLTVPIILMGGLYGAPVDAGKAINAMPTHQSSIQHNEIKVMLLIEFDEDNQVARSGMYEFPNHIIPIQIAEEWLQDPLPDYFVQID